MNAPFKPAQPLCRQRKSELPGVIMVLGAIGGSLIGGGIAIVIIEYTYTPPQELKLDYSPKTEFIDLTGKIRYGKDKSTGMCFANIRTADSDARLWRTVAHVPCEALERLK